VETADIEELSVLDEAPDLRLLQVLEIVVVGSSKVGAKAAVVASNDDTATASLLLGVDTVLNAETSSLDCIVEDGRVLVITSATEVDNAVGLKDVLGATSSVLSSTASNKLGIVVVQEVLVKGLVLLLGENGVVCLEVILVKQSLVTDSLDV
jgi:hypothetical protein